MDVRNRSLGSNIPRINKNTNIDITNKAYLKNFSHRGLENKSTGYDAIYNKSLNKNLTIGQYTLVPFDATNTEPLNLSLTEDKVGGQKISEYTNKDSSLSNNINIKMKINNINFKNPNEFFKKHIEEFNNPKDNPKQTNENIMKKNISNRLETLEGEDEIDFSEFHEPEEKIGGVMKKLKNELLEISKCIKKSNDKNEVIKPKPKCVDPEINQEIRKSFIETKFKNNYKPENSKHMVNNIAKNKSSGDIILDHLNDKNKILEKELRNIKNKFQDIQLDQNYKDLYPVERDTYEIDDDDNLKNVLDLSYEDEDDDRVIKKCTTEGQNQKDKFHSNKLCYVTADRLNSLPANLIENDKNYKDKLKKYEEHIKEISETLKSNKNIISNLRDKLLKYIPQDLTKENYDILYSYLCPFESCKWFLVSNKKKLQSYWITEDNLIEIGEGFEILELDNLDNNINKGNSNNIPALDKIELKYSALKLELKELNKIKSDFNDLKKNYTFEILQKEDKYKTLSEKYEKLKNFNSQLKKQIKNLKDEIDENNNKMTTYESKFKVINEKLEYYLVEYDKIKKSNEDLLIEKYNLKKYYSNSNTNSKSNLDGNLTDTLKLENEELKKTELEAKEKFSQLNQELEDYKLLFETNKTKFQEALKQEQIQCKKLREENDQLHKQIDNIPNIIKDEGEKLKAKLNKSISQKSAQNPTNLKSQLKQIQIDKNKFEESFNKLLIENERLKEKNLEMLKDLVSYDNNYKEVNRRFEESEDKYNELNINIDLLNCQVSKLKDALKSETQNHVDLVKNKKILEGVINDQKNEMNRLKYLLKLQESQNNLIKNQDIIINKIEEFSIISKSSIDHKNLPFAIKEIKDYRDSKNLQRSQSVSINRLNLQYSSDNMKHVQAQPSMVLQNSMNIGENNTLMKGNSHKENENSQNVCDELSNVGKNSINLPQSLSNVRENCLKAPENITFPPEIYLNVQENSLNTVENLSSSPENSQKVKENSSKVPDNASKHAENSTDVIANSSKVPNSSKFTENSLRIDNYRSHLLENRPTLSRNSIPKSQNSPNNEEITLFSNRLHKLTEKIEKRDEKGKLLNNEIQKLNFVIENYKQEISNLIEKEDQTKHLISDLENDYKNKIQGLNKILVEKELLINEKIGEVLDKNSEIELLLNEFSEMEKNKNEEIKSLNLKIEKIDISKNVCKEEKEKEINEFTDRINNLETRLKEKDEKIKNLTSSVNELENNKIEEIEKLGENFSQQFEKKEKEMKSIKTQYLEFKLKKDDEIKFCEKKMSDLEKEKNEVIKVLKTQLTNLEKDDGDVKLLKIEFSKLANEKDQEIAKLKLEMQDVEKINSEEINLLKMSISNLEIQKDDHLKLLKDNSQTIENERREIKLLNQKIKIIENEKIQDANSRNEEIEKIKLGLNIKIKEKDQETKLLTTNLPIILKEKDDQINEFKKTIEKLEEEQLKKEEKLKEESDSLHSHIEHLENSNTFFSEKLNNLKSEFVKLGKEKDNQMKETKSVYTKTESKKNEEIKNLQIVISSLETRREEEIKNLQIIISSIESKKNEEIKLLKIEFSESCALKEEEVKNLNYKIEEIEKTKENEINLLKNELSLIESKKENEISIIKSNFSNILKDKEFELKQLNLTIASLKATKEDKIKLLNQAVSNLEKEKERETKHGKTAFSKLKKEKDTEIINLNTQIGNLTKSIEEKDAQYLILNDKIYNLEKEKENEIISLRESIYNMEEDNNKKLEEIKFFKINFTNNEKEKKNGRNSVSESSVIDNLEKNKQDDCQTIIGLNKQIDELNIKYRQLENIFKEKILLIENLEKEIFLLNTKLDLKYTNLSEPKKIFKESYKEESDSTIENNLSLPSTTSKSSNLLPGQRTSMGAKEIEKLKIKILCLTTELETVKERSLIIEESFTKSENNLIELKNELNDANKLLKEQENKIYDYDSKILNLEKEINENNIIYQDTEIKLEKLNEENFSLNELIMKLKNELKEKDKMAQTNQAPSQTQHTTQVNNLLLSSNYENIFTNSSVIPDELQMKMIENEIIKEELAKKENLIIELKEGLINLEFKFQDANLEIKKLKLLNEEIEKDVENFKKINDKLLEKISNLEKYSNPSNNKSNLSKLENIKTINYLTCSQEEIEEEINNYKFQIMNLKELIVERDDELQILSKENSNYRNEIDKMLKVSDYDSSSANNISQFQKSRISAEINILDDKEKVEKYKEAVKNAKQDNKVLMNQTGILKAELKNFKQKYENLLNYEGKIQNFEICKSYVEKVIENHKPKNKEFEDIFKKLKEHFSICDISGDNNSKNDKKGFFGNFFSNKKK